VCARRALLNRGFTLLESLVAATLIGVITLAVVSGISAAQRVSFEGQKRILAAMAADDLLLELATVPYSSLLSYDGLTQAPGTMQSISGEAYPGSFWAIGRSVSVRSTDAYEPLLNVVVRGMTVEVTVSDDGADLLMVRTFRPEPTP